MRSRVHVPLCGAALMLSFLGAVAQSKTVTITEPAATTLRELFQQADIVASVKIVSGDSENYDVTIYKASVIQSFKGPGHGEMIYFGPHAGMRLGWEYIVFLHAENEVIAPKTSGSGYGQIHYSKVLNEGYGALMSSYECVFHGADVAQQCGEALRVCTDYIHLPKSTATFPSRSEDTDFGCRWVRKTEFVSALAALRKRPKID
jgi:hypothetical protein